MAPETEAGDIPAPVPPPAASWPLLQKLPALLDAGRHDAACCRALVQRAGEELAQRFTEEEPVATLVHQRALFVDALLRDAWRQQLQPALAARLALVATGGYGRGELHPCSDIDIMVLVPATTPLGEDEHAQVARLVAFLWDIGLEVGHSVRTIPQCIEEAARDVTVMTALLEVRLLAGSEALLARMEAALSPARLWPANLFFEAKLAEQAGRHARAHDTAYNLEPDVKAGPGGLRDIQTIGWVAQRHFGTRSLDELVARGFLTPPELRRLRQAQAFLWKVRFALHALTGRREDRLLFDHQITLARAFGHEDSAHTLAVEQLMQRYYRTVLDVSFLSELLLQAFRDELLPDDVPPQPLNERFQVRNQYLDAISADVFARDPSALLELFLLLQQNARLRGVSAATMRAVARHLWLIDEEFRNDPRNHRLFLDILRAPVGVTHELRRMNNYGVLGRYIPAFGRIVGRMQYDLFHAYTVDAHTLFVVSNLRRLAMSRYDHELPHLSAIMQQLPRHEIVYLAALFHDIAKGRGGDHSTAGAVDAEAFCLQQGLSEYDARLVAWLVRNHLELSLTAQKRDISDPEVISEFARKVGDQLHLDYLYVLTCADVRGTNPRLWNSWKASLFQDFHERVRAALRRGLESPPDPDDLVRENQRLARDQLARDGILPAAIARAWARLSPAYFLRHTAEEIAWFTRLHATRPLSPDNPIIAVQPHSQRGTTAILIFAPHQRHGFAHITAVLDQLGLTVVDARISPAGSGFSLDLYHVLEEDGRPVAGPQRVAELEDALWRSMRLPDAALPRVSRRTPRQLRLFNTPTRIDICADLHNQRSVLELVAADRPGLLSEVGKILREQRVDLQGARISTIGERAEDVFYVTNASHQPLSPEAAARLEHRLATTLDLSVRLKTQ